MESHHASMGRRKLEEIRQKKAAERNQGKQADLNQSLDAEASLSHALNLELEAAQNDRDALRKQLDESMAHIEVLANQLKEAQLQASNEGRLVADLKQSVKSLSVERDAAVMAKEDLLAQLRVTRRRLQEAEEEQYKAEEDAAALRAELKHMQHMEPSPASFQSSKLIEHYGITDQEINSMKADLQNALFQLQQEQQKMANEQHKITKLTAEMKELELALASSRSKETAEGISSRDGKWRSKVDKGKYEQHLRELASMVERLENGRQKLLSEIDNQSLDIEKLFMENAGLMSGLNETTEIAARWEKQLHESMKQNAELRRMLNEMKTQQAMLPQPQDDNVAFKSAMPSETESETSRLKVELTKACGEKEELNAQVLQLSLQLASERHNLNGLNRLYKPVFASIESRLLQIKQNPLPLDVTRIK